MQPNKNFDINKINYDNPNAPKDQNPNHHSMNHNFKTLKSNYQNNNTNNMNSMSHNNKNINPNINPNNVPNSHINNINPNNVPNSHINNNQNYQQEQAIKYYQQQLFYAYNLFTNGNQCYKSFNFYEALDKFEKALGIANNAYPYIKNVPQLRDSTEKFFRQLNQVIDATKNQIKNRFEPKDSIGFAAKKDDPARIEKMRKLKEWMDEVTNPTPKKIEKPKYISQSSNLNMNQNINMNMNNTNKTTKNTNTPKPKDTKADEAKVVNNEMREKILTEIVDSKPGIKFSDVIGLSAAKQSLKEIIVIPNLRPDLFTGLRSPPRGLLLFGPPGTGKTMIAKAVATECQCTFFNISASSLTSKWLGESEKLVRALFDLAFEKEPSVVFIDEIESILSKRSDGENEAMKRLKTEFLIQFDGVGSSQSGRVLIVGATNRPFDLDPAVIRRLPKRIYIGPFNQKERKGFIEQIIKENDCDISDSEFEEISKMCENYSNSDLKELCREAAYEPLREVAGNKLEKVEKLRPVTFKDFQKAVKKVRGTLTDEILSKINEWHSQFGALG